MAGTTYAVGAVASVQFGAAFAVTLFPVVGTVGTLTLRFVGAALVVLGADPAVAGALDRARAAHGG